MPRVTNRQRVVDYLLVHGSITNQESADHIKPRIFALSQEISRLEKDGYIFEHKDEKAAGSHWTRYILKQTPEDMAKIAAAHWNPAAISTTRVTHWECPRHHKFQEYGDAESGRCPKCNWQIKGERLAI